MSLNLLGKRKFSDINSDEYDTLSYSVLCCNQCRNSLIVRRYANDTYAPICSLEPHCKRCKHYVDCCDEQCPVCCQPESGEPVPSFSELVSAGVMCVKILELPVSFSVEPGSDMVVAGSASVEPGSALVSAGSASVEPGSALVSAGSASVEAGTDMVVAGSASVEPSTAMLGVRTSSRRVHLKQCPISFTKDGFHQMVGIYNRFVARVHDKLFSGDAEDVRGAAAVAPKFTVQELHKLKTEYDKGAAWTSEEVQELCGLPLIMLKAQWKDEHQLSTFRDQLTKLMEYISGLQQASGKHDQEIAALKQAIAELKQAEAGSSVVAAGGAGSSSAAAGGAGPSVVAAGPAPVMYGSTGVGESFCRISPNDTYIAAGVVPGTFMIVTNGMARIFQSTGYNRTVLDEARRVHSNSTFKGYTREDYRDMDGLPMIIRKLVWGLQAAHRESLKDRNESRDRIKGAEDRLKKLEAGPGYTRESIKEIQAKYVINAPITEEERAEWDQQPLILRKFQWRVSYNNKYILTRVAEVDQETAALKQENAELKQALASQAQEIATLKQATASQAQEIATLKQAMATQGQAVQSMDAHTAQIMQAVQAMMGPMRDELVELRQRVAMLESARPAGFCMAVKKEPKEPA